MRNPAPYRGRPPPRATRESAPSLSIAVSDIALTSLLESTLRWVLRHLLSLVVIVGLLLLGQRAWQEWKDWHAVQAETARLGQAEKALRPALKARADDLGRQLASLKGASLEKLTQSLREMDRAIAEKEHQLAQGSGLMPILVGQPIVETQLQRLKLKAELELLTSAREGLRAAQSPQAERASLLERHRAAYAKLGDARNQLDKLQTDHPLRSRLPGTDEFKQHQALSQEHGRRWQDNLDAADKVRKHDERSKGAKVSDRTIALKAAVDAELKPLTGRLSDLQAQGERNWVGRLWRPVQEVLPTATLILLGAILTPIAVKALFYFVLAPLAARRPPVRLVPGVPGALTLVGGRSSVSHTLTIDARHELLVQPEFLQSASVAGEKSTQWLLSGRFALTSLSAGMVALTRIRCEAPESFVISATQDALAEIAVLDLPAGSAVVMQPHHLIGVVQERALPLRISSHWRLNSLHAWLTLQLRYLALHGPARLIVQGARGVRLEPATGGRAISQAATIAFSANVAYSTRRCETFFAYLRGKQALLNDCFGPPQSPAAGPRDAGCFVYAELPRTRGSAGWASRGLEGLTDSVLKIFGI
jgi:hypothetical protein